MVEIKKNLVSPALASKVTYGKGNAKKYITIHETDNTSKGANANAHGKLQANGNSRQASWHYTVDADEIVQSFEHTWMCWAGGTTKGNKESIHIEICVNSDGDYKKAVQNAAELVRKIMKDENIPIENVVQHNHWSGKNCPSIMRGGKVITWTTFINMIKATSSTSGQKEEIKESVRMFQPSSNTLKNEMLSFLEKAQQSGILSSKDWTTKLRKGELSLDDALCLMATVHNRSK